MPHPRKGIPAHGAADRRPDCGEYFSSRGLGMDGRLECFVCGGAPLMRDNIAAFVACRAAGERVVELFGGKARLDYRDFEPDRVQVKVGACDEHKGNLEALHLSTSSDGVITERRIAEARNERPNG